MKLTKYYLISWLLLLTISLMAQVWPKYYGQSNRNEYTQSVVKSYDNGHYLLGYFRSNDWNQLWAWLIKTDINGEVLWDKILSLNYMELVMPNSVVQTSDGGLCICGSVNVEERYVFAIKLDACGNKEWCKWFHGQDSIISMPICKDVKETVNGEILLLLKQFGNQPHESIHLIKLDTNGETIWKGSYATMYNYPDSRQKFPEKLIITHDNKYLIIARGYFAHPWAPGGPYALRPVFVLVDEMGQEEWVLPFGLNDTIIGGIKGAFIANNNDYWGVGYRALMSEQRFIGLAMNFDGAGNEISFKEFDFSGINEMYNDGGFDTAIPFESEVVVLATYGNKSWNYYDHVVGNISFESFDPNEELVAIDYFTYPNAFVGLVNKIAEYDSIKYLITNSQQPLSSFFDISFSRNFINFQYDTLDNRIITYDNLCLMGTPQSSIIFLHNCDLVTGVELPNPTDYRARISTIPITIYPNPVKDQITFALENTEHHRNIELRCFNLLGMQQHQAWVLRGQQHVIASVINWTPGIYIAVVYSDEKPVGRGKFVVH